MNRFRAPNTAERPSLLACTLLLAAALVWNPRTAPADEIKAFADQWQLEETWTGDFDGMVERRMIRVLVVPNKMLF